MERGRTLLETIAVLAVMGIIIAGGVTGLSWTMRKIKVESNIKDMNLVAVDIFSEPVNFARTNIDQGIVFRGMNSSEQTATKTAEDMFAVSMSGLDLSVCEDMFEQARHYEMIHESTFTQADRCANGRAVFYYQLDSHVTDNQGCGYGMVWDETAGMCCRSLTLPENNECRIYTMVNASAGVCPDYTQTNLSGPCGTNGYCNNGACVSCPASTESCSIDADEYDPATQCLMTKKVVCGENEVCEGDICVCAEGYELYEGVCLEACEGSGMTGLRDENGNCLCLEGTNAETCACPAGYIYLDGACQRFECRGGPTSYDCFINDKACGLGCNSVGRNCLSGICYADECSSDEPFVFIPLDGRQYYYACYRDVNDVPCYRYGQDATTYFCAKDGEVCMIINTNLIQIEGTCDLSICTDILSSAEFTYWGWVGNNKNGAHGSCDFGDNLVCFPLNNYTLWRCLKNGYLCGTGCVDPLNCGDCPTQNCLNDMVYNPETGYCEDLQTGVYCTTTTEYYQYCYQKNGERCELIDYRGYSRYGNCNPFSCPEGFEYGYVERQYYGCIKQNMGCFHDSLHQPATCYYNGFECGRGCHYDGTDCGYVFLPQCTLLGHCPQTGYDMTDGCTCDGSVTTIGSKSYCCPSGHTYLNGGCTLVTCPEGQEADESGICRDKN